MRIALIAPPFISVPPQQYGGTELFIAELARGLAKLDYEVVVYTNGESTIEVERRWLYPECEWPIKGEIHDSLKDINHTAWAVADARHDCDIIHLNNAPGLPHSRFVSQPFVYTIHHPSDEALSEFYAEYPEVSYVTISRFQQEREKLPRIRTIHHGIHLPLYELTEKKQPYLSFIGRIAPVKGVHIAIEVAQRSGVPLKIAGEVQPMFREYYETQIKPHVDGKFIEFVGTANLEEKNQLLGNSLAMLFPIQWNEPFGLVTIEAMACGTPVLAMPGGSVPEIVVDGVSGFVCETADDMVRCVGKVDEFRPAAVREHVAQNFSLDRMVRQYADLYKEILAGKPAASAGDEERAIA
ncbi:MAG TPA: glycosyltransferase family 4 protein [Terriglobales bacterium]|nr:glycosyltransferase family 4 protein [Terriglobales bacterium]